VILEIAAMSDASFTSTAGLPGLPPPTEKVAVVSSEPATEYVRPIRPNFESEVPTVRTKDGLSPVTWLLLLILAGGVGWKLWQTFGSSHSLVPWRMDFVSALNEGQSSGKLIMLDFTASWCPPCREMKRETWNDPGVAALIEQSVVPVLMDVDAPGVQPVAEKYGIQSIPAIVVVDSAGREVRRASFMTAAETKLFIESLPAAR
jgi:thiol:disulfide interchange protein